MNETVREAILELRSVFQGKIDELAKRIDFLEIENKKLNVLMMSKGTDNYTPSN